jgi:alkylhydroperoxidase family enzyme
MEQVLGSPPRIDPLPDGEIAEAAMVAIDKIRTMNDVGLDTPVPEFFATVGKHPELLAAFLDFGIRFLGDTALPDRQRELAILRTGWLCGAPFEWGEHVLIARQDAKMSAEEIEWIVTGSDAPGWDELDRAVLKACEELHAEAMISDATWEVLARHLTDQQLIELPVLAGQYHKVAFVQNSLRFRLREGNPGLLAR